MTTTIHITRMVSIPELDAMVDWLNENAPGHDFPGQGMEFIAFPNSEQAILFKLLFGV